MNRRPLPMTCDPAAPRPTSRRASSEPGAWWRLTTSALTAVVAAASLVACGPGEGNAAAQTAPPPAPDATAVHEAPPSRSTSALPARAVASTRESAAPARAPAPQPPAAPVEAAAQRTAAAEAHTGTVIRIDPVERAEQPSGAGAVVGGLLGAVVGHQFGGGSGRTLATVGGAVGGAFAGNAIEKQHSRAVVGYRVEVRLDDGSTRSFRLASPGGLTVGSRVHVEGSTVTAAA
jgi:outer membrane lipoprotein SlyB